MEVLLGVQTSINHFYEVKTKIDEVLLGGNLTLTNKYRLDNLRKSLVEDLSDILSTKCEDVLSTSFYMQVNSVESIVAEVLSKKNTQLDELEKKREEALKIVREIVSLIYSIDILKNSIHIKVNSDNGLLELKTRAEKLISNDKRLYAINFLSNKLDLYKEGLFKIIDIAMLYKRKDQIPLDKKQEILDVFNTVALENQKNRNRRLVFSISSDSARDSQDDALSVSYLRQFEDLFVECLGCADIRVTSFYDRLKTAIYKEDISKNHISNCVDFIAKKYSKAIENEYRKISLENYNLTEKIKQIIAGIYTYDGMTILENVVTDINSEKRLPEYLEGSAFESYIKDILFDFDISIKDDVKVYNVIDELNESLVNNFNINKYLELFELSGSKVRQIAEFRQYYISLLSSAKEALIEKYVSELEDYLEGTSFYVYVSEEENRKIDEVRNQIDELKEAGKYINKNYRKFDKENLKIYIDTLEKKYELPELYKSVIKKKSYLSNKFKLKSTIYKENLCISEFIEREDISCELINTITENIVKDDELKREIASLAIDKERAIKVNNENLNDAEAQNRSIRRPKNRIKKVK